MKKAKIIFRHVPNSHCRDYHTTAELSEYRIHRFERPLRDSSEKYLEDLGEVGRRLVEEILTIDGVDGVSISPYHLQVVIGEAFDWNEDGINDGVVAALKKVYIQKYEVSEEQIEVTEDWGYGLRPPMSADISADDDFADEENDEESPIAENNEL